VFVFKGVLINLYQKKSLKTNQTGRTFFTDLRSGDKVAKENQKPNKKPK